MTTEWPISDIPAGIVEITFDGPFDKHVAVRWFRLDEPISYKNFKEKFWEGGLNLKKVRMGRRSKSEAFTRLTLT